MKWQKIWTNGKKGKRGLENDWAISAFLQFLRSSGKLAIVRNFHWKEKKWILRALWGRNVWFLYDGMFVHASFQEKVRVCFICLCVRVSVWVCVCVIKGMRKSFEWKVKAAKIRWVITPREELFSPFDLQRFEKQFLSWFTPDPFFANEEFFRFSLLS